MIEKKINLSQEVLKIKGEFSPKDISEKFKVDQLEVTKVIDTLIEDGFKFVKVDGIYVRTKSNEGQINYDATKLFKDGLLHFGLVSDTHLGSKFERLDALEVMYDRFEQAGIKTVFHVGDLTDGSNIYKGQEFEQNILGQEAQINYAIKNYPKRTGIQTIAISGNHDLKMYEHYGADPLTQIARARKDIIYIGQYSARVKMAEKVNMDMLHPMGYQAYAVSYRPQRNMNAMNPEDLPQILTYGHYHNSLYLHYRGVEFLQTPCFKDPSMQFEKRLGYASNIGGWIIDGKTNGETIREFTPRLVTFGNK